MKEPMLTTWARRAVLASLLLLAAALAWREDTSVDFGTHVATGQWILEHHAWPRHDLFSYTAPGHANIDLPWLAQVKFAAAYNIAGMAGVNVLRLTLVLGTLLLLWAVARRLGAHSPGLLAVGFGLGLIAWEPRFLLRPEIFTYFFLALELYCLRRFDESEDRRWLHALVPLGLVWANCDTHAVFGPVVAALFALFYLFRGGSDPKRAWAVAVLMAACLAITPYTIQGILFQLNPAGRVESNPVFAATVTDLASPFAGPIAGYWPILAARILFGGVAVALAMGFRKLRGFDLALAIAALAVGAIARRNLAVFVLCAVPPALAAAQGFMDGMARPSRRGAARGTGTLGWVAVAVAGLLFLGQQVVAGGYYVSSSRLDRFGAGESRGAYPVQCAADIRKHNLPGPLFNSLNVGSYLAWRLGPARKVYIHSQVDALGDELYGRYLGAVSTQRWQEEQILRGFNTVVISYTSPALANKLFQDPDWALLQVDGGGMLFAKLTEALRPLAVDASSRWQAYTDSGKTAAAIAPRANAASRTLFSRREIPWELIGTGNSFLTLSQPEAARALFRQALLRSPADEPAVVRSYAEVCLLLDRKDEAKAWFGRLLELAPGDEGARQRYVQLGGER